MDTLQARIKTFVSATLAERAERIGSSAPEIEDSVDMLASGLLDSMAFVDLMVSVEDAFDVTFDFGDLAPPEFTTIAGFLGCIVRKDKTQ